MTAAEKLQRIELHALVLREKRLGFTPNDNEKLDQVLALLASIARPLG